MNFILKLVLFSISGLFISYGLVLQVRGILHKGLLKSNPGAVSPKKPNTLSRGILLKFFGILLLGYLIYQYQTEDVIYGLISFFISSIFIILWFLLARRFSIR